MTQPDDWVISYAQRYEDMHLLRALGGQPGGFYIDIGAGHPVYDNVSFAFYLRGWRGITAEPNPWLNELTAAVRPDDSRIAALVGAAPGEATYYLVEDFHGFSTTVEQVAQAAHSEYGKRSKAMPMPVTTLRALCERHAPAAIDFLKIDVEGAEHEVLAGGDWNRFRPKVIVLEAVTPVTMTPAWDAWEPFLTSNGYVFSFFDGLNRYYVAQEHAPLAGPLGAAPAAMDGIAQFRAFKPALEDAAHPDHRLARLFDGLDMVRLPLLPSERLIEHINAEHDRSALTRTAGPPDIGAVHRLLFGTAPPPAWIASLQLGPDATIGDLYRSAVASAPFRAACGRISASSAW